jgi:hypothetical protein
MEDLIISLTALNSLEEWRKRSLTRKSRQWLHSRWEFLPSRNEYPSETDQEEERDAPDKLRLGDISEQLWR